MEYDPSSKTFHLTADEIRVLGQPHIQETEIAEEKASTLMWRIDKALDRLSSIDTSVSPIAADRMKLIMEVRRDTAVITAMVDCLRERLSAEATIHLLEEG